MIRRPPRSTLFPTRRSSDLVAAPAARRRRPAGGAEGSGPPPYGLSRANEPERLGRASDRKSTRLNSSHMSISYAVFCLKKKKKKNKRRKRIRTYNRPEK